MAQDMAKFNDLPLEGIKIASSHFSKTSKGTPLLSCPKSKISVGSKRKS